MMMSADALWQKEPTKFAHCFLSISILISFYLQLSIFPHKLVGVVFLQSGQPKRMIRAYG
jgi:hypothetical protein